MKLTRVMMLLAMLCFTVFMAGCRSSDVENPNELDEPVDRSGLDNGIEIPTTGDGLLIGENGDGPTDYADGAGDPYEGTDWVPVDVQLPVIYFAYDSNQLGSSETVKLDKVVEYLKANNLFIIVEGHCDDRGTVEYNRGLGERRALSVQEYMTGKSFGEDGIKTVSYGKDKPAVEGTTPEARAANRRAQLIAARPR